MKASNFFVLKGQEEKKILNLSSKGRYLIFLYNFFGDLRIEIEEKGVEVFILGVYVGKGEEKFSLSTVQHHKVGETMSDLLVKGVFTGNSQFIYQGLIRIEKGAQKSYAYQKNQNLILSPKAYVESRPFLEILANDVFCTHGSTTGRLDKEQIVYLKMRGLNEEQAKRLLINGFIKEVFDRIEEVIEGKLPDKLLREKEEIFKNLEKIKI